MVKKRYLCWEIIGAIFTIIAGTIWHFAYDWSGKNAVVASIFAVNESVWEHLKLTFFPILIFAIVEYFFIGKEKKNFWLIKAFSAIAAMIFTIVTFYLYQLIFAKDILAVDIGIFVFSVFVAYLISYLLSLDFKYGTVLGLVIFAVIAIAFVIFTYFPPKLDLFYDFAHNVYGRIT